MPVITRSQSKQINTNIVVNSISIPTISEYRESKSKNFKELELLFTNYVSMRLKQHNLLDTKEERFINAYNLIYNIRQYFPDILINDPQKWCKFAKVIYNKAYEFEYEENYESLNKEEFNVDEFIGSKRCCRAELLVLFKKLKIDVKFENKNLHMDTGFIII